MATQWMIGAALQGTDFVDLSADFDKCGEGPSISLGLKDGKCIDITMVDEGEKGLACGCVCPACEQPLVAAKGEQRQYFRHHRRSDCDSGQETGVHILAKEILAESLSLFIPPVIAKYGDLEQRILKEGRNWPFRSASVEKTLVGSDNRRIRPDLIVEGDFKGEAFELLIEIRVRHKQERWKEDEIRKRGLAAIEIDLSKEPPTATRDYYRQQIVEKANRRWLVNRHIDSERLRMRRDCEEKYGGIAEKIEAAYSQLPLPIPDRWVETVVGAGLEELIGLEIKGGGCFVTSAQVWQAAILYRYVLSTPAEVFETGKAVSWLEGEGLLKSAFSQLLRSHDRGQRAHVEDCLRAIFQDPRKVVSLYAGELARRGKFQKLKGEPIWRVNPEVMHAAQKRHDELIRWRLRLSKLLTEYHAIKRRAVSGDDMSWEAWLRTPLSSYQEATPREFLGVDEARFETLLGHLKELRAMLEPGGAVPADLLELPLEPERDARLVEQQKAREKAASRRDAEKRAREIAKMRAQEEAARERSRDEVTYEWNKPRPTTPESPPLKAAGRKTLRKPLARLGDWLKNRISEWTRL